MIVDLIGSTRTKTGLSVRCELDRNSYPKGIAVSDDEMAAINIRRDEFPGEWNYWASAPSGRGGPGDAIRLPELERLQLSLRADGPPGASPYGVEVESVVLR